MAASVNDPAAQREKLLARPSTDIRALFEQLRERIFSINNEIAENPKSGWFAYRYNKNFLEVYAKKKEIEILLRPIDYEDPQKIITRKPETHQWVLDRSIIIKEPSELDYAMTLIHQSYNDVARHVKGGDPFQRSFEKILEIYRDIRTNKPFGQDPDLWRAFETIRTHLEKSPSVRSRRDLKITWSVGRGNWARVPWIAILDQRETKSTQNGVYCVFLFREDTSGVYLTFNQGVTEPKNRLGPREGLAEVKARAAELRGLCRELEEAGFRLDNEIDIMPGAGLGKDYESSTIAHKLYEKGAVPVDEDIAEDIDALLRVYDRYLTERSAAGPNQAELKKLRSDFLNSIPGFKTFSEAGADSTYGRQERNYKDELIQIFHEEIEPRLKDQALGDPEAERLADDIHACLRRRLETVDGPQNLLTWRDFDFFNHIDAPKKRKFIELLHHLLYGEDPSGARLESFNVEMVNLMEGTQFRVGPAWTRVLPTFFLMIAHPSTEIFIKTRPFNRAAQRIMGWSSLEGRTFDAEQYERMLKLANVIRTALENWGWAPRDMIDVQSFIWVTLSGGYEAEEPGRESEEAEAELLEDYKEPPFEQIRDQIINGEGLRISERTLRRYHLSLKSRGFVILSGVSGTGKTWLTEAYAKAVDAAYLLVPVAPNWTTNEDLLGFLNPLDGIYHHTPFSRFLSRAAAVYEKAALEGASPRPFHLVLDEMNLARIEYYFAKFLSAMEVRARAGQAEIELAPDQRVYLTPNLFFVGTVNVDETTHGFADKVYDRAQLIELEGPRELLEQHLAGAPYSTVVLQVWDAVSEIAPFAYRILDEFGVYTQRAGELGIDWEEALDEQLVQKVLPKLKGADPRVGEALQRLVDITDTLFPLTKAKAELMLERFRRHGFTSYF